MQKTKLFLEPQRFLNLCACDRIILYFMEFGMKLEALGYFVIGALAYLGELLLSYNVVVKVENFERVFLTLQSMKAQFNPLDSLFSLSVS